MTADVDTGDLLNQDHGAGSSLMVSELFGPTFQGEGSSLGRPCFFLRLGGCNQHCSFCDTPYTWDWTGRNGKRYHPRDELQRFATAGIYQQLEVLNMKTRTDMLVISGGEPLLQQERLVPLVKALKMAGWRIEVETAGTIVPSYRFDPFITQYNVSPKLENSGNPQATRRNDIALQSFQASGRAIFKFVVVSVGDFVEIDEIVRVNRLSPIYVMPEGVTAEVVNEHAQTVAQEVILRGWNLTTRLQVQLYGNRRGV